MGEVMTSIVGQNQAAFVPGQIIHNHILLTYELIKGYNRKGGTPRCMMQLDIQKAYDTIDWKAMECVFNEVGFPNQFTYWIMLVVTSVSYRFNINGNYTTSMEANRGLRQGDPISPLLFVIMMEYLNRCFQRMQKNQNFNFHAKCEKIGLTNLCFADDLLLFARGDEGSVTLMMEAFDKFSKSTGLKCLPLPKTVIKKINSICRTFFWTGSIEASRKAPVAWKSVCQPKRNGGLNLIDLEVWNHITLLKLLWNLCGKSESLWVKWIHAYYIKNQQIMEAHVPDNASWIIKAIMQLLHDRAQSVVWRTLFYGNMARPRALVNLWLACHERLATRDRLHKYGSIETTCCCFCNADEMQQHLMFNCSETKGIWRKILEWIQIDHSPLGWHQEVEWIIQQSKGKGGRAKILKLAFTESVYEIWRYRNDVSFDNVGHTYQHTDEKIIDAIVYRGWTNRNLRTHLAKLMM
ncbi:hypothetical protein TSUD_10030 [Trifolium subterraneum]|nr:hypothetical protein TSUD_10030 [Trifolium subterraneum]